MKKKLYLNFLFTGNSLVFEVKCTGIFLEFSSTFSKILFLFSNFAHFAHSLVLHWGHEIILYLVALTISNCSLSDEWWWLYNQVSDMMLPLCHHSSDPPSKFWLPPPKGGIWKILKSGWNYGAGAGLLKRGLWHFCYLIFSRFIIFTFRYYFILRKLCYAFDEFVWGWGTLSKIP